MTSSAARPRVVILGGGFAGISTAMALGRHPKDVETHLVSDENYFVFQPLLPEVVSCGIEASHIVNPIRQLCRGVTFHCGSVESIDLATRRIKLVGGDARRVHELEYDHLVLAIGLVTDVNGIPGMSEHCLSMKTLGDAFALRTHVLSRLEDADIEADDTVRRKLLTFVCIGGGFSGVETAAELNDMIKEVLRFYPVAGKTGHRMVLVHSGERILNELSPELAEFAQSKLRERGVEMMLKNRVKEATADGIVLSDGHELVAGTVVSTVGNSPNPLIASLDLPKTRGRLVADEFLRVGGAENIWALGDAAIIPDATKPGAFCPPTAQYAMREGTRCAANVIATVRGHSLKKFEFGGLGQLAVVGRRCGVAQIFGIKMSGFVAWFIWRWVYWMKLPGLRCKIRVGIDWALDLFFPRDITKLDMQRTERLRRAHYREGEMIIRQGEIGDRFYVIESGEVEIIQEENGRTRTLGTRTSGESFGEVALLRDTPRSASVRCLSPVNVVTFSRQDFRCLVSSYGKLRAIIEKQMTAAATNTPETD